MRQSRGCATAVMVGALLMPASLGAQRLFRDAATDVRTGVSDVLFVFASPLRADQNEWGTFAGVMAIAAAASLADDDIDAWIVREDARGTFDALEFFRERQDRGDIEWSDVGAARWLSKFSLGLWAVGLVTDSEALRDAGMGCLSTWIAIAGTREVNYRIWMRRRPSDAGGNQYLASWGHGEWIDRSFIAGHFANPMGCTKFWTDRFDLGPLEPALYATSFAVAASRMVDRRHWLSDIIVAGALSYAVGKIIAHRQDERRRERACAQQTEGGRPGDDDAHCPTRLEPTTRR